MYIVDFSDKTIRYINFKKSLLGKFEVQECGIVNTQENNWEENLRSIIKNQKIALVIPESASHIIRFQAPRDTSEETLKAEVEQQIARGGNIEHFAFDCGIKKKDEGASDVMCLAAEYKDLVSIFSLVQKCDAKPILAVPESLAVFRILREGIIEGEVVLLIDIEDNKTHFIFYDSTGPIVKKSYPTDLKILDKSTIKVVDEFTKDTGAQINRIVLNGELSAQIEPFEFRKSVNTLTIKAEDVLKDRLSKLNLSFECGGENVGRYINAIATGLLDQDASSLNLVKNDVLMNVEKYAMAHKDELDRPQDIDESSEEETPDNGEEKKGESERKTGSRPRLTAEPIHEEKESIREEEPKFEKKEPMSHTIGSPDSQFRSSFRVDEPRRGGGGKKKIFLFILVALLVALIAGIALYLLGDGATAPQNTQAVPTQEPSPSPTPTPELEREDLTLQVLNGSGEAGVASDVAAALEDLGYAGGIDTGNADSYDYEETVIQLKPEFEDYFDLLREDLENEGYVIGDDFEELDEDAETDGVVIVGSLNEDQAEDTGEEEEEEEPTPTPEEEE